jgi:hypothetical protein
MSKASDLSVRSTASKKEYKKNLEAEIQDGASGVEVEAHVPYIDSIPAGVTLVNLKIKGMLPWQAKKVVRFLKDNDLA